MPAVEIFGADGVERVFVPLNTVLASAVNCGGHRLDMPCGGAGRCFRCRVIARGGLSGPSELEREHIGEAAILDGVRLACEVRVLGDARVEILGQARIERIAVSPITNTPAFSPYYLKAGLNVDIGTTTMAAALLTADGHSGAYAMKNPQTRFGADVITRIQFALQGHGEALAKAVRGGIESLADTLLLRHKLSHEDMDAIIITGNTAMIYMLTGTSPAALACAPFKADRLFGEELPAQELLSLAARGARLYLPRCISTFVGADITAALVSTGLCDGAETALLVDIGTNGEAALWHEGKLSCCSTSAGPAFEGAGMACGVYAVAGAIDRVWVEEDELCYSTINDARAIGLCGSGIVDIAAVMLKSGVVNEGGAIQASGHPFEKRIEYINGQKAFRIAPNVVFTAGDIRKLQLAKGAIRAGIETLLTLACISAHDVSRFFIAGGFGSFMDISNAIAIGLIPGELGERARVVGNAALGGAASMMQDKRLFKASERLAHSAATIDLSANPVFAQYYIEHMAFA